MKHLIKTPTLLLKGLSQIMLQEDVWTGFLFLIGLFLGHWSYACGALLATGSGTLTAKLLRFDKNNLNQGLYGFSPALVGIVLPVLFEMNITLWGLVIVGGSLASLLQEFFLRRKFPAYTFPFILVSWIFIFCIRQFTDFSPSLIVSERISLSSFEILLTGSRAFGQVIFQGNIFSGLLFFIGVSIASFRASIFGLIGALLGGGIAYSLQLPISDISLGIYGFNAVLTAIVFSGKGHKNYILALIGVLFTIFIQVFFVKTDLLTPFGGVLTFPFVLGTWFALIISGRLKTQDSTLRQGSKS